MDETAGNHRCVSNDFLAHYVSWFTGFHSLLETGHTAILFRELWNYTIDAIVNPFVIGRIDWFVFQPHSVFPCL